MPLNLTPWLFHLFDAGFSSSPQSLGNPQGGWIGGFFLERPYRLHIGRRISIRIKSRRGGYRRIQQPRNQLVFNHSEFHKETQHAGVNTKLVHCLPPPEW
jgi:hypothetical protein